MWIFILLAAVCHVWWLVVAIGWQHREIHSTCEREWFKRNLRSKLDTYIDGKLTIEKQTRVPISMVYNRFAPSGGWLRMTGESGSQSHKAIHQLKATHRSPQHPHHHHYPRPCSPCPRHPLPARHPRPRLRRPWSRSPHRHRSQQASSYASP